MTAFTKERPCHCGAYGGPESHARWCVHARAAAPAHSKSEYKRRAAMGDASVLPPLPREVAHVHSTGDFCAERAVETTYWPVALYTREQLVEYARGAVAAATAPVDARPVTAQEDRWLRDAAKRSGRLVAAGETSPQKGEHVEGFRQYLGDGMFVGESIADAALGWAGWCDVRGMVGLSEFLRKVAATAPAPAPVDAPDVPGWKASTLPLSDEELKTAMANATAARAYAAGVDPAIVAAPAGLSWCREFARAVLNAATPAPVDAARKPVAWAVYQANVAKPRLVHSEDEAESEAGFLGEYWVGTDALYAATPPAPQGQKND